MSIYTLQGQTPRIDSTVYVAPDANVIGDVTIGPRSSVWFSTTLRGDTAPITIGEETNIQDLSMAHADPGKPLIIGNRVTIGHRCVVHGCVIEDDCLIGMGAIIMNEARIGRGSIVGAGAIILEKTVIPPFSLVVGSPGQVKKTYDETILATIYRTAKVYMERGAFYQEHLQIL
ncbi:MAG: gamma carbonic anhydrase family protein [SAR324 cluster bacterium]|nr:gamma carbonic anhydrase family protein [SAR324 cluster bacterium]MBF0353245.1 gamma carbonic anhydrase family protein [SAR324 cluster bacterium]